MAGTQRAQQFQITHECLQTVCEFYDRDFVLSANSFEAIRYCVVYLPLGPPGRKPARCVEEAHPHASTLRALVVQVGQIYAKAWQGIYHFHFFFFFSSPFPFPHFTVLLYRHMGKEIRPSK
jgi:hypothetical protein